MVNSMLRWFRYATLLLGLLVLHACGGGGSSSSSSNPISPPPPDFTLAITSNSTLSVEQGGSSIPLTVTVNPLNGFMGSVSISFPNLPTGVTLSPPGPLIIVSTQSQTVMVSASTSASVSADTINVQGTSGALSHSAPFNLSVTSAASFQLKFNSPTVTLGPNSTAIVELDLIPGSSLGNANVFLSMNSTCIPNTGVCTTLTPSVLTSTQTKATLTLQSSFQVQPATNIPISITGGVGSDTSVTTLSMNIIDPLLTSNAPLRSTFRRTDMDATGVIYDPIHKLVFAAVVQLNEVVVFSSLDAHTVATISVPEPDGIDITVDGTQVIVGSRTRFFYVLDTSTFEVVKRVFLPASATSDPAVIPIPEPQVPFSLASGKVMFYVQDKNSTARELVEWDPITGIFTDPTPPSMRITISFVARSMDHSQLIVQAQPGIALFNVAADSFGGIQNISAGTLALNPNGNRVAVLTGSMANGGSKIAVMDTQFNTIGSYDFNGQVDPRVMIYSRDGTVLYVRLCTRIRKSMQLAWVSESRGFGVLRIGLRPLAVGMATSSKAMVTEPRPSGGPLSWGGYPEERCEADVRL